MTESDPSSSNRLPQISQDTEFIRKVKRAREQDGFDVFFKSSLLIDNLVSEARDLCAAERNFISWQRASAYLALAGGALILNFRFPAVTEDSPSMFEVIIDGKFSYIMGIILICLSLLLLVLALFNYAQTVIGYIRRESLVVNSKLMIGMIGIISITILAINIVYVCRDESGKAGLSFK